MSKSTNKVKLYLAIAAISLIQGLQIGMSPVIGAISEHYTNVDYNSSIYIGVLVNSGWRACIKGKQEAPFIILLCSCSSGRPASNSSR